MAMLHFVGGPDQLTNIGLFIHRSQPHSPDALLAILTGALRLPAGLRLMAPKNGLR